MLRTYESCWSCPFTSHSPLTSCFQFIVPFFFINKTQKAQKDNTNTTTTTNKTILLTQIEPFYVYQLVRVNIILISMLLLLLFLLISTY